MHEMSVVSVFYIIFGTQLKEMQEFLFGVELLICVKRQYLVAAIDCEQSHHARFGGNTESAVYLNDKLCCDLYNSSMVVLSSKMNCDQTCIAEKL
jgi:hypothetical protein